MVHSEGLEGDNGHTWHGLCLIERDLYTIDEFPSSKTCCFWMEFGKGIGDMENSY